MSSEQFRCVVCGYVLLKFKLHAHDLKELIHLERTIPAVQAHMYRSVAYERTTAAYLIDSSHICHSSFVLPCWEWIEEFTGIVLKAAQGEAGISQVIQNAGM